MAILKRLLRRRCLELFCLAAILFASLCGSFSVARATPVTFRFDAEIGRISTGTPIDSGIDFAVGNAISGRFTFEPCTSDGCAQFGAPQPYEFILDINGSVVSAPSFSIVAANNLDRTIDGPGANFFDSLSISGSLSAVDGQADTNYDSAGFVMSLWALARLSDQTDVLETASIPADTATWNRFLFQRMITLSFSDSEGRSTTLFAEVAEFSVIPEPSTSSILFSLLAIFVTLGSLSSNHT